MKHLNKLGFLLLLFIFSCVSATDGLKNIDEYSITIENSNIGIDIELYKDRLQTVHRLSGTLHKNGGDPDRRKKLGWESSHSWVLGDTLGYVVRRTINAQGEWAILDTITVTGFEGFDVPTVNPASITRDDGSFSGMIAPILPMKGETMKVKVFYKEGDVYEWDLIKIKLK